MIRLNRGTDQKIRFTIYESAINQNPVDLSGFYDIVFEVFGSINDKPIIRKTIGTNSIVQGEKNNQVTVFVDADDTMRFSPNNMTGSVSRIYQLQGYMTNGRIQMLNQGFFYCEAAPCTTR